MTTTSAMFIVPVLYYPYSEQLYNKKQLSSATVCAVYATSSMRYINPRFTYLLTYLQAERRLGLKLKKWDPSKGASPKRPSVPPPLNTPVVLTDYLNQSCYTFFCVFCRPNSNGSFSDQSGSDGFCSWFSFLEENLYE